MCIRDSVGEILERVVGFTAPMGPHDDCTLIALRYLGEGANRLTMAAASRTK